MPSPKPAVAGPAFAGDAPYRALFETTLDGIMIVDGQGCYVDVNDSLCRMLKAPRERLVGAYFKDFIPEDLWGNAEAAFAGLRSDGSFRGEFPLRAADGSLVELEWTSRADFLPGLHFCVAREVSARKSAERRLAAEHTVARLLAEAATLEEAAPALLQALCEVVDCRVGELWCIDEDGEHLRCADTWSDPQLPGLARFSRASRTLSLSPGQGLPGRVWAQGAAAAIADLARDESFQRAGVAREASLKSGFAFPVAAGGEFFGVLQLFADRPFEADEPLLHMMTAIGQDVAHFVRRRRAEAEVQRLTGDLERRVSEMERMESDRRRAEDELRRAKQTAEEANQAKDRFLATLSHELRTPLTPVLATISALERDARLGDLAAELRMIRRNVELEARLIDDLLDLTRIARGKLELRREIADLAQVVADAVRTSTAAVSETAGPRLACDLAAADHRIWADAPRLTQVFWNLLSNAVKFTPPEGVVTVRSREEEGPRGERWLAVDVADTGIGIEPAVLPRIFEGFEQGERTITRRFGGLGLGLAISKVIVELHGGELTAASAGVGRGSTFTVRLPAGDLPTGETARLAPEGREPDEAPESAAPGRSLRILLVEDHADTAEAMADLLCLLGHTVTVASGVAAALEAAAAAPALDLLLSDVGLPDGSGLDLMRRLAQTCPGLPGIALSGYGMEEDVKRSLEAGFARHLTKPVAIEALAQAIRQVGG